MQAHEEDAARLTQETRALMQELRLALHDLCQPLSALQCRLYLAAMDEDLPSVQTAIAESLTECDRMIAGVRAIQDRVKA